VQNSEIFVKNQNISSCVVHVMIKNSQNLYINEMRSCLNTSEFLVKIYFKLYEENITYVIMCY